MKTITILDTAVASDNLGDQIILDAIMEIIDALMPDAYRFTVATHEYMTRISRSYVSGSDYAFVAGTNILASNMEARVVWKLNPWDAYSFKDTILLGCGWMNYMKAPNTYSRWLLKRVLSPGHIHSVRDSYTAEKVHALGKRVVNTSCPTLWMLDPHHCLNIPTGKAQSVVTTLTYYLRRPEEDAQMIRVLKDRYKTVYFWPQQRDDLAYLQSLGVEGVTLLNPTLNAYNRFLEENDVDFVGTRLHGGIRALQKLRRALIVRVDNRATEISKDTGLPTMERRDFAYLNEWISGGIATTLALPTDGIALWKSQFAAQAS